MVYEVTATKTGRKSNPAEVEIRVVEHAEGVTICAVYPPARREEGWGPLPVPPSCVTRAMA